MANSSFIVPLGQSKPSAKSITDAQLTALRARPVFIPPTGAKFDVVTGYRFAAVSANAASNIVQQLERHNKSTMVVQAGVTWDSALDRLTFSQTAKAARTAEVQLAGAYFKAKNGANFDMGLFEAGVTVPDVFPAAQPTWYSLRTKQDDLGNPYPFTWTNTEDTVGFEIQQDSVSLKYNNTVLFSYPLIYVLAASAGFFTFDGVPDNSVGAAYSAQTEIVPIDITPATRSIIIEDILTGESSTVSVQIVGPLIANDLALNAQTEDTISINLLSRVSGGSSATANTVTINLVKGSMPAGLVLANNVISGTVLQDGERQAIFQVADASGQTAQLIVDFSIVAKANVTIQAPNGEEGKAYNFKPFLPAGFESLSVVGGLPSGLSVNPTTALFSGIPTTSGAFEVTVDVVVNGQTERIAIPIEVFDPVTVLGSLEEGPFVGLGSNIELNAAKGQVLQLAINGGSGSFVVSANNGAIVGLNYQVEFVQAGRTVVTVIDGVTGNQVSFTYVVTAQDAVMAYAVEEEVAHYKRNRPLITQVGRSLTVAFSAWTTQDFDTSQLIRHNPIALENIDVSGDNTPFALFRAQTPEGKMQMPRAKNFLSEIALNSSMIAAAGDIEFGLGRMSEDALKYSVALTTVAGERQVEVRERGALVAGSRQDIAVGQILGFGVINDGIGLYIDGVLKSTLQAPDLNGLDYIVTIGSSGVIMGGQIGGLDFSIVTPGAAINVGSIHPQTGQYTPGSDSVSKVKVRGSVPASTIFYEVDILILKESVMQSLDKARIQNRVLRVWVADIERGDREKLRITESGSPDANQIKNAVYLGTLKSSGKWDVTEKRTDFANDAEIYDTGHTVQKYTITGEVLSVLSPAVLKALVPYIHIDDSEVGTLSFSQKSTGCVPRRRVILIWESTSCSERKVWDAIEFHNCQSFTPFNGEIGSEVATMIPMSIEAYPDEVTKELFKFYRYDEMFVTI